MEEKGFSLPQSPTQKKIETAQKAHAENKAKKKNAFIQNKKIRARYPSETGYQTRLVGFLDFGETDK